MPGSAASRAIAALVEVLNGLQGIHDAQRRAAMWARYRHSTRCHQTTTLTARNRYPQIFSASRRYFEGCNDLRILSFGCSTGEEVLTLREYFPHAVIVGAEINRACLDHCKRLAVDDKTSFIYSDPAEIAALGPFDAIFCMAVLQRTPLLIAKLELKSLKEIYPFEKFDGQITEFVRLLAPGGLLAVRFSQYFVSDSTVAGDLEPLAGAPLIEPTPPMFDRNSQRIEQPQAYCSIHVKKQSPLA